MVKKLLNIYSDNIAPYRMAWAEGLSKKYRVRFCYHKRTDSERNQDWLIKNSNIVEIVKLNSFIFKNKAFGKSVYKDIKKTNPDVIIFDGYGIPANFYAISKIKKKRLYFINIDGFYMNRTQKKIGYFLKKMMFSKNCRLICGSQLVADYYSNMFKVPKKYINSHNFSSIHKKDILTFPLSNEEKRELRHELGLCEKTTILSVARFLDWKRIDLLISGFRKINNEKMQLVIIGEGAEEKTYKQMIAEYKMQNVRIVPFMKYDELTSYYKASDLFVLPSDGEVWGLVLNEAMSFGLPSIASNTCVAGQTLLDKDCIFKSGDVNSLIASIDYCLQNNEILSKRNINKIKDFTIENEVELDLLFIDRQINQPE